MAVQWQCSGSAVAAVDVDICGQVQARCHATPPLLPCQPLQPIQIGLALADRVHERGSEDPPHLLHLAFNVPDFVVCPDLGEGRCGEGWRGVERGGEGWRGVERGGEGWRGVGRDGKWWRGVGRGGEGWGVVERDG